MLQFTGKDTFKISSFTNLIFLNKKSVDWNNIRCRFDI